MIDELDYAIWLASINNMNILLLSELEQHFGGREGLFTTTASQLSESGLVTEQYARYLISRRNPEYLKKIKETMQRENINYTYIFSGDYPEPLKEIYDPPPVLFYKGSLPDKNEWMIGMVGARRCTPFGQNTAIQLARSLSLSGISIVSGMARGIDSYSHLGCLECSGRTYAVLGCGVDICYPADNQELYHEIPEHGAVLSEYVPGTAPTAAHFPKRNRIIAALSKGIVVVEARKRSGSLITAEQGLNMGKDIFAVPGRPCDLLSEGCNHLIKAGAKPVMTPEDILEEYDIAVNSYKNKIYHLDYSEKVVYDNISLIPKNADELSELTRLPIPDIMTALISLEIKGAVRQIGKSSYVLNV